MVKHSLLTHNQHEMIVLHITSGPFQAIYDFHSSLQSKSLFAVQRYRFSAAFSNVYGDHIERRCAAYRRLTRAGLSGAELH